MKVPHAAGDGSGQGDGGKAVCTPLIPSGATRGAPESGNVDAPVSTAREVADTAVGAWNAVAELLAPVIGQSSVSTLYRRCLVSVRVDQTWLPSASANDPPADDWLVLHAAVSRQTVDTASEACMALSMEFHDLLGSLIGPSLTEQLLHPVSALPSTGSADQDTLP